MSKLSLRDKDVVQDFTNREKNIAGSWLWTDGKTLEIIGAGREVIAKWSGRQIVTGKNVPYTRAQQSVVRYLRKITPKNVLKEDVMVEADSRKEADRAFRALEKALKDKYSGSLPTKAGPARRNVDPDEFMYMGPSQDGKWWMFKHRNTRNYIQIHRKQGRLAIPKGGPFMKGFFDESTMSRLERLLETMRGGDRPGVS